MSLIHLRRRVSLLIRDYRAVPESAVPLPSRQSLRFGPAKSTGSIRHLLIQAGQIGDFGAPLFVGCTFVCTHVIIDTWYMP